MFGTSRINEKIEDLPGPGNYEPRFDKDSTKVKSRDALIIGPKDRHGYLRGAKSPGPGHYEDTGDARLLQASKPGCASGTNFSLSQRKTEFDNAIE